MNQTNLSDTQDQFLQELTSLMSVLSKNLNLLHDLNSSYYDIRATLGRIEDKIDSDKIKEEEVN